MDLGGLSHPPDKKGERRQRKKPRQVAGKRGGDSKGMQWGNPGKEVLPHPTPRLSFLLCYHTETASFQYIVYELSIFIFYP